MCKRALLIVGLVLLCAVPVSAHLTGAFAKFLAIVYDDATISQLQHELDETKAEIEALTPQVEQAERVFREDQQQAISQLQFYSEMGLDTWLAMIQSGEDIVDLLGNKWVMEQQIETYLQQLNVLYRQYEQLQNSQQTLEGHAELLAAIEKNLQAREAFLLETAGLELDVIANYLDIDWTAEVEAHIIADLQRDADTVNRGVLEWEDNYFFDEVWLNERSNARYFFRGDHVYIEYEREFAHVLVLGQVLQNADKTAAQLVIEAGFYNGFFLPEELLVELPSFSLSYEQLRTIPGVNEPFITQRNGGLQLQSK